MPHSLPRAASSPPEPPRRCLVLAASGRALAEALGRSGVEVAVIDCCGDLDTRAAALWLRQAGHPTRGFCPEQLGEALAELAAAWGRVPVVLGGGLEAQAQQVDALLAGWPLLGSAAAARRLVTAPRRLAPLLEQLEIVQPAFRLGAVAEPGWLEKAAGSAGGLGVRWLDPGVELAPEAIAQRHVAGASVSLLLLADGVTATAVGASSQHGLQPSARWPFRHSALVAAPGSAPWVHPLAEAARRLVPVLGIVGLFGVDAVWPVGGAPHLVDVNLRPTASLELHDRDGTLAARHLLACCGRLWPPEPTTHRSVRGRALVWAERALSVPVLDWPSWVSDRPAPGSRIEAGAPLCTVHAAARDEAGALATLAARLEAVLGLVESNMRAPARWHGAPSPLPSLQEPT